jgi:hypothetical protein
VSICLLVVVTLSIQLRLIAFPSSTKITVTSQLTFLVGLRRYIIIIKLCGDSLVEELVKMLTVGCCEFRNL